MGAKLGSKSGIRWEGRELQGWIDGILQRKSPFAVFWEQTKAEIYPEQTQQMGICPTDEGIAPAKGLGFIRQIEVTKYRETSPGYPGDRFIGEVRQ